MGKKFQAKDQPFKGPGCVSHSKGQAAVKAEGSSANQERRPLEGS